MNQPPIAIVVTFGKKLIEEFGGGHLFERFFEKIMRTEDGLWLHKCLHSPKHDILHVYVVMEGHVEYKLLYAGHEKGETTIFKGNKAYIIEWPRIILSGPIEKAPYDIPMRGFQGFRYLTEELF